MLLPSVTALLRLSRLFLACCLFGAGALVVALGSRALNAIDKTEVRLSLNTTTTNLLPALQDMQKGFEDGWRGEHHEVRGPLPALQHADFALAADPHTPLLQYQEPSAWKRVALLGLGATDDSLSLAGLFFFSVGSWLLYRLLLDVTPEEPFTEVNAGRLRGLALLVLGLNLWEQLAYLLLRGLVPLYRVAGLAYPLGHYVRLNTEGLVPGVEVGIMLIIIAAVYQRGVVLRQEAELTI